MTPELSQKLASCRRQNAGVPQERAKNLGAHARCQLHSSRLGSGDRQRPGSVTVKVLKVVNSAYYRLPKQITSISHAVVYLGFNTIKNLALGIAAIGMLPKHNEAGFDVDQYLLYSLFTAGIAKLLASQIDEAADPMDCFIGGLLHDFGKVVLAQFLPVEFKQALTASAADGSSLHTALQQIIGADHAVVGAMLVSKWRFAPDLIDTIAHQFETDQKDSALFACVYTANQISKRLGFGFGGNHCVYALPSAVAKRMGGSLEEIITSAGDMNAAFEDAKLFARI